MNITLAQYLASEETITGIKATIDGQVMYVPIAVDNRHYAEIKRQVDAGELTIADAD
jgi:hypothetical protein